MTSGDEHSMDKHTELTNKINRLNKNVKLIMDTLNTFSRKVRCQSHRTPKTTKRKKRRKKNWIKSLLNGQVGRPVGTWESKRETVCQYAQRGQNQTTERDNPRITTK